MSVPISEMRAHISSLYSGSWADRVKQMPDYQVIAIYFAKKFEDPKPITNKNVRQDETLF